MFCYTDHKYMMYTMNIFNTCQNIHSIAQPNTIQIIGLGQVFLHIIGIW